MIYAVNYDLKRPGQNYEALYVAIKGCGVWWHHLGSTWLVDPGQGDHQTGRLSSQEYMSSPYDTRIWLFETPSFLNLRDAFFARNWNIA